MTLTRPSVLVIPLGVALLTACVGLPRAASADGSAQAVAGGISLSDQKSGALSVFRGAAIALEPNPAGPGEAVRAWLSEHAADFGLEPGRDALRVTAMEPAPRGGTRVRVQQFRDGLAVEGGDAMAVLDAEGRLRSVISGFVPRGVPVSARGPRAEAERVAYAVGLVWPTDPRGPLVEKELFDLLPPPGVASASYAIRDQLNPPATPVAPDDWRFQPDDPSFDQVNTYWHVQHYFRDFLAGLGYPGPPQPLEVSIHAPLAPQVAFTKDTFVYLGLP